ncbi:MAG: carboxymuconolactone decarboxylase family protein [Planctomycetota bacterium]|jgi:AhpD family alkylhydroperoxidase
MLPSKIRNTLFDRLSVKTMSYVSAVPANKATGLTREVYDMIQRDFFVNGSLTSRSKVPQLMASIWTIGRESMLVDDHIDRTTKEAICAVTSTINDCPYCGDMLVSLVHAGDERAAAEALHDNQLQDVKDPHLRAQLAWVEAAVKSGEHPLPDLPFTDEQMPELLATIMSMSDINRFSHVVMEGSPVNAGRLQGLALRLFGNELRVTKQTPARAGEALRLLPRAELPNDLRWARPNERIADALARYVDTVERITADVIPDDARGCVEASLSEWKNEQMPLSAAWADDEVEHLTGDSRHIAKLAIMLAKAPYQVTKKTVEPLAHYDEQKFIKVLAWCSYIGSRRLASIIEEQVGGRSTALPKQLV